MSRFDEEPTEAIPVPNRGTRNMNQPSLDAARPRSDTLATPSASLEAELMETLSSATTAPQLADASAAWDEAFLRVESYLHAHQINSRLGLNRLTSAIIEEAGARAIERPQEMPVALAMEVVRDRMARWFGKTFVDEKWADEKFRAKGRLALLMADMPTSWAPHFLNDETLPPEISQTLLKAELQPGPELRLSKMPPAELEFGFGDTDEKVPMAQRWALHPAIGVCMVIFTLMGAAWIASH